MYRALGLWGESCDEVDGAGVQSKRSGERRGYGGEAPCKAHWTGVRARR